MCSDVTANTDQSKVPRGTVLEHQTWVGKGALGFPPECIPGDSVWRVCCGWTWHPAHTASSDPWHHEAKCLQHDSPLWVHGSTGSQRVSTAGPWVALYSFAHRYICWSLYAQCTVYTAGARPGPDWMMSCSHPSQQEHSDEGRVLTTTVFKRLVKRDRFLMYLTMFCFLPWKASIQMLSDEHKNKERHSVWREKLGLK